MDETEYVAARGRARPQVSNWVASERLAYADGKWEHDKENAARKLRAMQDEGYGPYWMGFVENYLKRAELLGVQTPQGRQAMGKAIATLLHCLETAVICYGPMPSPGVPSGEILPYEERESVE